MAGAKLGLTQAQAAELLATSQANVSAYERGRLEAGPIVIERIDVFAALSPESVYASYSASTMPSAAAQIRADLAAQRSESDMLRVIIQASDDIWVLCQVLGLRSVTEVWQISDVVWGEDMLRDDIIELVTADLQARGLR